MGVEIGIMCVALWSTSNHFTVLLQKYARTMESQRIVNLVVASGPAFESVVVVLPQQ